LVAGNIEKLNLFFKKRWCSTL